MDENPFHFEKRKQEHIALALLSECEASECNTLDQVFLSHRALPDLNAKELDITSERFHQSVLTPFIVSSMTAGHDAAEMINHRLVAACHEAHWAMGVGSQRRELFDKDAKCFWKKLRKTFPSVPLFSNLGIAQVIESPVSKIQELSDNLEASAFIVHANPLQEMIQPEGTPSFRGAYQAIARLVEALPIPVIVKETGCGFSKEVLATLAEIGVHAVDVSGLGGTHWGRIEGQRAAGDKMRQIASQTFKNWGINTVESVLNAMFFRDAFEVWGSGGVRHGLDAARLLALGATTIGFAKPALQAALVSETAIYEWMKTVEYELKTAMFCTDSRTLSDLRGKYDIRA